MRASWLISVHPRDEREQCAYVEHRTTDRYTVRCRCYGALAYGGQRWCKCHHPIVRAELEARRLDRHIRALMRAGFRVHVGHPA